MSKKKSANPDSVNSNGEAEVAKQKTHLNKEETTAKYRSFVKAWGESDSVAEVAKKCGLNIHQCNAMASACRKNKIDLKRMPRKGTRVDWKALLEPESAVESTPGL